jgi:hypothetical protein
MTYRIRGLDPRPFEPLFSLSDEQLAEQGMVRMTVDAKPGFPCRVSLVDREPGEEVILLNHISHEVANPYRAMHAIFVARARQAEFIDRIPPVFETRMLSLRAFDDHGMMIDALVTRPGEADGGIRELFANPAVATIHAHNAARGCFSAKIERM